MKAIAFLFAAVMLFAGCSAKQDDMMSDAESSVSSILEPDKSSSSQVQEESSGSEESSAIGAGSQTSDGSDPGSGSESAPDSKSRRLVR